MRKAILTLLALTAAFIQGKTARAETQTFTTLTSNWNLITFQVIPSNPSPAAVFGSLPGFQAAWTYDAATTSWRRFVKSSDPARDAVENALPSIAITSIAPGKAYWVYLGAAPGSWQVSGTAPLSASFPALTFTDDAWNSIGIPVGTADLTGNGYLKSGETINLLSVLTRAGFDYSYILRWEQGTQRFQKATPSNTDQDDFSLFDAWRGYMLFVTDPQVLRPVLLPAVRADVDAEPDGNYPSHEDLHISASPTPLDGNTQTHIAFFPGEDVQTLGLSNTGGGIMIWDAIWTPTDATNMPEPWITLAYSPTEKTDFINNPSAPTQRISQSGRDWTRLRGVTTLENDILYLRLDRKNLAAGTYHGTLQLQTSVGPRTWQVTAQVSGLQGDWRGLATLDSVNGKKNRPPDVDLQVSLFEDASTAGLMRGMIDSTQALLWPVDAPLIGHITDSNGNAFSLGGAYVLPPGDQNLPPYDSITGNLTAEDVDWNNDGKLDNTNPFPFPIHREILMQGKLVTASPFQGYEIQGEYIEVVSGMLRQSIRVLGSFKLSRESSTPFSRRAANAAPIVNNPGIGESNNEPSVKRTYRPGAPVALPATRTVQFTTDLALTDLQINVKLDTTGLNPATLTMKLVAPNLTELVLHNQEAMPLSTLANITYPTNRSPFSSLSAFISSVGATKGTWSLVCSGGSLGSAKLIEFTLTLIGQPVYDVKGRVANGATGVANAQVLLTGLPISASATTDANGDFTFARLPGIPVNFTVNQAGFQAVDPSHPGLGNTFTVPGFTATVGNTEETRLLGKFRSLPAVPVSPLGVAGFNYGTSASPYQMQIVSTGGPARISPSPLVIGYSPLTVDFSAIGTVSGVVNWNFGDSTSGIGASVSKTYSANGAYQVTFSHGGAAPQSIWVIVQPSPGHSTAANNFFQTHPTAGGSLPTGTITPQTPGASPLKVDLVTLQHTYTASGDIDLAPFTLPANRAYASDGFDAGGVGSFTFDPRNRSSRGAVDEDHNYNIGDPSAGWPQSATTSYPTAPLFWYDIVSGDNYAGLSGYAFHDPNYHPHPKVVNNGGVPTTHFRIACNIGAAIQPAPSYDLPPDASGIARNRSFQLVTGPLAVYSAP